MLKSPIVIQCPVCRTRFYPKAADSHHSDVLTVAQLKSTCPDCEAAITVKMDYEEKNSESPECEKLRKVSTKSQAVGEFIEWLCSGEADDTPLKRSVILAASEITTGYYDYGPKNLEEKSTKIPYVELPPEEWEEKEELAPFRMSIEKLLAKFFNIDLNKVEDERRAILKKLQEANKCQDSESS